MTDKDPKSEGVTLYSIARLAAEFGMSRDTVSKRLQTANIRAERKVNGYPVYRLRDVVMVILGLSGGTEGGGVNPDTLSPEQRRAWFQSEKARLEVMEKARKLIPVADVEDQYSYLCKRVRQWIDTLPDIMERDANLTPTQVDALHASARKMCGVLYDSLVAEPEPEEAPQSG